MSNYLTDTAAFTELIGENFLPTFQTQHKDKLDYTHLVLGAVYNQTSQKWEFPNQTELLSSAEYATLEKYFTSINFAETRYSVCTTLNTAEKIFTCINLGNYGNSTPISEVINSNVVRQACASLANYLKTNQPTTIALSLIDTKAVVEGLSIGAFHYNVKGKYTARDFILVEDGKSSELKETIEEALIIAQSVILTIFWVNTPPNLLYPEKFAAEAEKIAKKIGLKTELLKYAELIKQGFGGIVGVGQGSSRKPCLLILDYQPSQNSTQKVGLVGKGITFDSGGISIKPASGMEEMTSDMAGAASMIATIFAIARLELPLAVQAVVPMAENLPSGEAQRPGDVITQYGGKTVEVLNTDAEGRLILADALVKASENKPNFLIDAATLTGAQVVALGDKTFGIMGSPKFNKMVFHASEKVGESSWPMPFPAELIEGFASKIADLTNHTNNRSAGMLAAGTFLSQFVPDDIEWSHLDIAGPAYNSKAEQGLFKKGATGIPVRTLIETLTEISAL